MFLSAPHGAEYRTLIVTIIYRIHTKQCTDNYVWHFIQQDGIMASHEQSCTNDEEHRHMYGLIAQKSAALRATSCSKLCSNSRQPYGIGFGFGVGFDPFLGQIDSVFLSGSDPDACGGGNSAEHLYTFQNMSIIATFDVSWGRLSVILRNCLNPWTRPLLLQNVSKRNSGARNRRVNVCKRRYNRNHEQHTPKGHL